MSNTFAGKIIAIMPEKQVSDKFKIQQIVVEQEDGKYPKKGLFDFVNDRIDTLHGLQLGESIVVHFEPDARQGNDGRWWGSSKGWKIDIARSVASPATTAPTYNKVEPTPAPSSMDADSDLPF